MRKIAIRTASISDIPMFHGTNSVFHEFAGMVWATPDRDLASQYGSNVKEVRLDIHRPFNADLGLGLNASFVNLTNEAVEQSGVEVTNDLIYKLRATYPADPYDIVRKYEHWEKPEAAQRIKQMLLILGFDGIMYREAAQGGARGVQTYAALDSSQVRIVN